MNRDEERIRRIGAHRRAAKLDALVCAAPENVLMLSGYKPVTGVSVAVVTAKSVALLVPSDERELAKDGWADEVVTFEAASMKKLVSTVEVVQSNLAEVLRKLDLARARIGYEAMTSMRPGSYVSQNVFIDAFPAAAPDADWVAADSIFGALRQPMSQGEIERLRLSCRMAAGAYEQTVSRIHPGMTESAVASALADEFTASIDADAHRAMCFAYCMSGPNAYEAFAAYQRSRSRQIKNGDLVLLHCNSCVEGFWTDITRTFVVGEADERQKRIFDAIFAAREAALKAIRPGVSGAQVDTAARQVMCERGFEKEFKHPTGHGVGFTAIDHNAPPRIHPASSDVLEAGMVFNVEPGIYIERVGGARHCDMVVVTRNGCDLLTDFLSRAQSVEELL